MKPVKHEADFAHSLTDLMSGVAVMFLVVAAIFMVQASRAKKRAQLSEAEAKLAAQKNQADARKYKLIDERDRQGVQEFKTLHAKLEGQPNIDVDYDENKDPRLLTIVFNRDNLRFASGACDVDANTRATLRQTLREIFPTVCESAVKGLKKTITLEGHTDNQPPLGVSCPGIAPATDCFRSRPGERCLKQGFESNVKLSAARAQYVFFEAREALQEVPLVAQCLDRDFMVAGRGPMEPLDGALWSSPRTDAQNEENRRVVIKVRLTVEGVTSAQ